MSRTGLIRRPFGDARYSFRLTIAGMEELDDLCGVGPGFALGLIRQGIHGNWKAKMVREVIRIGLVGGDCSPLAALALVDRYGPGVGPIQECLILAAEILGAALFGPEDDAPGEVEGGGTNATRSPTGESASPTSTEAARPSAGTITPSEPPASGSSPPPSRAMRRRMARTKTAASA